MNKLMLCIGGAALLAGGGTGYLALQPSLAAEGTSFGDIDLSGLARHEALAKLESWWAAEKEQTIEIESHLLREQPEPMTLEELGVRPDWDKTLAKVRFENTFSKIRAGIVGVPVKGSAIDVAWRAEQVGHQALAEFVEANARKRQPARVLFENGQIVRNYEVNTFRLDADRIGEAALTALTNGARRFELPVVMDEPAIPKTKLDKITDVVSEFTTRFNQGQYNRSTNIRLSSERLNGIILMPGEVLSYNETVGKRIASEGFRLAGIYVNGRHDQGIGGGICQVSSTLFNAALLANLEIVERRNHSMPVPYLAVGRDATVAYGSIDLKIKNSHDTPVSIVSETAGGTVTFRVLGQKDPGLEVAIITTDHTSWPNQVRYVSDGTLSPGSTKIVEPGSTGRKCVTWRILRRDGQEIAREKIATSTYQAFPKIVARGPDAPTEPTAKLDLPPEPVDG